MRTLLPAVTFLAVLSTTTRAQVPVTLSDAQGNEILHMHCAACHGLDVVMMQRLTSTQWKGELDKMRAWGATLVPQDAEALAAWLEKSRGPGAPLPAPRRVSRAEALARQVPTADGAFSSGDAVRGRAAFTQRCAACHGPEGRGGLGLNLVDKPFLYRADDVAQQVRRGRNVMPPQPDVRDAELADILAFLRAR